VLLDSVPDESRGRWSALLAGASRLGIAVVFVDDSPVATGGLAVDASRTVTEAEPHPLAVRLGRTHLFGLRADEAVELLGSATDANRAGDDEDETNVQASEPPTVLHRNGNVDESSPPAAPVAARWPEPSLGGEGTDGPLVVEVLGPYRTAAFGQPVTTGLRGRAKTLLAWCLLRPEDATLVEVVDALWPDTPPDRVLDQFWHPLDDLRAYFLGPAGETLDVSEKVGEHYRPNAAEITCDLWDFQGALAEAARTTDDESARQALRRAVDAHRGDLLAGSDYPWVELVRQDLHRRALDAHLRLAELEDHAGHPDAAVDALERVIDLDRYAEEPYRRLITLHAAHNRLDAVTATWPLLQRRLADLDVDGDDVTARLYRSLTAPDAPARGDPGRSGCRRELADGMPRSRHAGSCRCYLRARCRRRRGDRLAVRVVGAGARLLLLRGGRCCRQRERRGFPAHPRPCRSSRLPHRSGTARARVSRFRLVVAPCPGRDRHGTARRVLPHPRAGVPSRHGTR